MALGSLGDIVFTVSDDYVLTYNALSRTARARFADHPVVHGKPASEFTGTELDDVRMRFEFNATLGISPREETAALREMLHSGDAWPLIIGSEVWGFFTLREVGDDVLHSLGGEPMVVEVEVTMREYVDTLPGPGSEAMAKDMSSRAVTGRGGPSKINGAAAPLQVRSCTARK